MACKVVGLPEHRVSTDAVAVAAKGVTVKVVLAVAEQPPASVAVIV